MIQTPKEKGVAKEHANGLTAQNITVSGKTVTDTEKVSLILEKEPATMECG